MSRKKRAESPVISAIERLLSTQDTVTSGDVAEVAHVSRQAAHYQLSAMAARGELEHEGAGRGSRYRRRTLFTFHYELDGLAEDIVWAEEKAELQRRDLVDFRITDSLLVGQPWC